jgi:hypothetical protein
MGTPQPRPATPADSAALAVFSDQDNGERLCAQPSLDNQVLFVAGPFYSATQLPKQKNRRTTYFEKLDH